MLYWQQFEEDLLEIKVDKKLQFKCHHKMAVIRTFHKGQVAYCVDGPVSCVRKRYR